MLRSPHLDRNDRNNPNIEITDDDDDNNENAIPAGAEDDVHVVRHVFNSEIDDSEWFSDDNFSVWDYYDDGEDALTDFSNADYVDDEDDFDDDDEDDLHQEDDLDGHGDLESDDAADREIDVDEHSNDSLPAIELYVPYHRAHSSYLSINDSSNSSDNIDDFVLPTRNISHSLRNSTENVSFTSSVPDANSANELQKHWTEDECWDST